MHLPNLAVAQGNVYICNIALAGNELEAVVACGSYRQGFPHLVSDDRGIVPAQVDGDVVVVVVADGAEEAGIVFVEGRVRLGNVQLFAKILVQHSHAEMLGAVGEVHIVVVDHSRGIVDLVAGGQLDRVGSTGLGHCPVNLYGCSLPYCAAGGHEVGASGLDSRYLAVFKCGDIRLVGVDLELAGVGGVLRNSGYGYRQTLADKNLHLVRIEFNVCNRNFLVAFAAGSCQNNSCNQRNGKYAFCVHFMYGDDEFLFSIHNGGYLS